jgi:hypothetical protein
MAQHGVVLREDEILAQEYGEDHWRVKGYRLLHRHWFILLLAALMIADIIFMMVDLVLAAFYPECTIILNGSTCEPESNTTKAHLAMGRILQAAQPHEAVCLKECVENPVSVENAKVALTICSLIILILFLIELLVHLIIIGVKRFVKDGFLVVDLSIVLVSIGLEIYLLLIETALKKDKGQDAAVEATTVPLIIFARSWRLLRIGHGTYKEAHDLYGERIRKLEEEVDTLKKRLANTPGGRARSSSSSSSSSGRRRVDQEKGEQNEGHEKKEQSTIGLQQASATATNIFSPRVTSARKSAPKVDGASSTGIALQ